MIIQAISFKHMMDDDSIGVKAKTIGDVGPGGVVTKIQDSSLSVHHVQFDVHFNSGRILRVFEPLSVLYSPETEPEKPYVPESPRSVHGGRLTGSTWGSARVAIDEHTGKLKIK